MRLLDMATGTEIATLKGNKQPVFCLAITPDRRTLVTGNKDGAARLWNLATGQRQATLKGHEEPVLSVAVTPDGKMLVTGGFNGTIKLWDMAAGKRVAALKCDKGSVFSLAITQDGKVLAAACSECTVVIRLNGPTNKSSGPKYLAALYHLPGGEWAAISPDNRFVCSEGGRQYIAFRDNLSVYSASDLPELECPEGILQPVIQA